MEIHRRVFVFPSRWLISDRFFLLHRTFPFRLIDFLSSSPRPTFAYLVIYIYIRKSAGGQGRDDTDVGVGTFSNCNQYAIFLFNLILLFLFASSTTRQFGLSRLKRPTARTTIRNCLSYTSRSDCQYLIDEHCRALVVPTPTRVISIGFDEL